MFLAKRAGSSQKALIVQSHTKHFHTHYSLPPDSSLTGDWTSNSGMCSNGESNPQPLVYGMMFQLPGKGTKRFFLKYNWYTKKRGKIESYKMLD